MATRRPQQLRRWATGPGGALLVGLGVVGLVLVVRIGLGAYLGDSLHRTTILGVIGGVLGSVAMIPAWWARGLYDPPPAAQFWDGMMADATGIDDSTLWLALHVVYGAVLGGLYPRLAWLTLEGAWWPTLPTGLLVGAVFGLVLVLPAVLYAILGLFDWRGSYTVEVTAVSHLVYGATLGFIVGLNGVL